MGDCLEQQEEELEHCRAPHAAGGRVESRVRNDDDPIQRLTFSFLKMEDFPKQQ